MLHYKGATDQWRAEAVSTTAYLINRTTNSMHLDMTPYELSFKIKPRLDRLRAFGSKAYAHVEDATRTKLEAKSFKCIFLGYPNNTKGYRVYDMESGKVKVARSLQLDERKILGIYDTNFNRSHTIIKVTKDDDAAILPEHSQQEPIEDETMNPPEASVEDVEMHEAEPEQDMD